MSAGTSLGHRRGELFIELAAISGVVRVLQVDQEVGVVGDHGAGVDQAVMALPISGLKTTPSILSIAGGL